MADYVVSAVFEAETGKINAKLDELDKKIAKTGESGKDSSKGIGSIFDSLEGGLGTILKGTALLGSFALAANEMWDAVKRAEEIGDAEAALSAFTETGAQAEGIMNAVRDAADGMLTKFDATRAATKILSLGLADSAKGAAELTELAVSLGDAFGKEALPAVEDFTNMLATGRIMGLKDYGISMNEVKKRAKELMDQTKGLDEKTATLTATLEAARAKLNKLKEDGYEAGDATTQLSVVWQDLTDEFVVWVGSGAGPVIKGLGDLLRNTNEYRESLKQAIDGQVKWTHVMGELGNGIYRTRVGTEELIITEYELLRNLSANTAVTANWIAKGEYYVSQTEDMTGATEDLNLSMESIQAGIDGAIGRAWEDYTGLVQDADESLDDFRLRQDDARRAIADTTTELIFQTASLGLNEEATLALARKMGLLSETDYAVIEATRLMREAYESGAIPSTEDFTDAVQRLNEKLDPTKTDIAEINRLLDLLAKAEDIEVVIDFIIRGFSAAQIEQILKMAGKGGGGGGGPIPRAQGGSTVAGSAYLVGERGPELFVPSGSGTIINNSTLNSSNVDISGLQDEIRGLRADLARQQAALPMMMASISEKGSR